MLTVLIFPGGRRAEAVLLSSTEDSMRLAIAGRKDTCVLSRAGERWISESGVPVEFGAMIALGKVEQAKPRTMHAGKLPC
ncbi:MAG TPA: hypothetical protein VKE70_08350 [Candidatus Solibacter sp.]|nr:hypothetical protein [Candidatus Solibacter sp.]